MITPAQCRAARGLLDWTQQQLADEARVGVVTVRQLEAGNTVPRRSTLEVIQRAFERAGVDLINENGRSGVQSQEALAGKNKKGRPQLFKVKAFPQFLRPVILL